MADFLQLETAEYLLLEDGSSKVVLDDPTVSSGVGGLSMMGMGKDWVFPSCFGLEWLRRRKNQLRREGK